jgi:hypothetical protein
MPRCHLLALPREARIRLANFGDTQSGVGFVAIIANDEPAAGRPANRPHTGS